LVGTTADFRRFSPLHPLPINHLSCENSEMQGRIGEVRIGALRFDLSGVTVRLKQPQHAINMREVRAVLFQLAFSISPETSARFSRRAEIT